MSKPRLAMVERTASEELASIAERDGGMLSPAAVVEFARNPKTVLHGRFEWDDAIAGPAYRLWQARKIISREVLIVGQDDGGQMVAFAVKDGGDGKRVRAYISLGDDRRDEENPGYRATLSVLSDEELRANMLEEAKADMQTFRRKFSLLSELAKVFEAMDSVLEPVRSHG